MKTFFVRPLVTEKAMGESAEGRYQFFVPTWATKPQIKNFVTTHFNVTVVSVTTSTNHPTKVTFKRRRGSVSEYKKATVRLKPGESIAELNVPVESAAEAQSASNVPEATPEVSAKTESTVTVRKKSQKRGV